MITSTSTVLEDFEYLNNLDQSGQIDQLNSEKKTLIEKYGSGDAFKQAYKQAYQQAKKESSYNGALPVTEMLQEAQTGDANLAESIDQSHLNPLNFPRLEHNSPMNRIREGVSTGPNIREQVVPSTMYKEKPTFEDYNPSIGEISFGMPGAAKGVGDIAEQVGGYLADQIPAYRRQSEIAERRSETGDAKYGEMDDFDAYKKGMIKSKLDLYQYDKDMPLARGESKGGIEGIKQIAQNFGGDRARAFLYDKQLKDRYNERVKAMGMKSAGGWDNIYHDDERYDPNKGLQIKGKNDAELKKREEIVKKAEMMNPGDPNASEKALNEYLITQKTKIYDPLEFTINVGSNKGTGRASDTAGWNEWKTRQGKFDKDKLKKQLLDQAKKSGEINKGGLADLKKATKGKGWEMLMHIGLGIAGDETGNMAKGIQTGLKNYADFDEAFSEKASDYKIVTLADGSLVRVNKATGEVINTGEKGATEETAAIKSLKFEANELGIDVKDLIHFKLTSGDKSYEENLLSVAKFIMGNSMVPNLEPKDARDKAAELLDLVNKSSIKELDSLLQSTPA